MAKTLKTNHVINCANIEEARTKSDNITNGVIVEKEGEYLIVNYKTAYNLRSSGYVQVW